MNDANKDNLTHNRKEGKREGGRKRGRGKEEGGRKEGGRRSTRVKTINIFMKEGKKKKKMDCRKKRKKESE